MGNVVSLRFNCLCHLNSLRVNYLKINLRYYYVNFFTWTGESCARKGTLYERRLNRIFDGERSRISFGITNVFIFSSPAVTLNSRASNSHSASFVSTAAARALESQLDRVGVIKDTDLVHNMISAGLLSWVILSTFCNRHWNSMFDIHFGRIETEKFMMIIQSSTNCS